MKFKLMFASLVRAFAFSKRFPKVTATRARTIVPQRWLLSTETKAEFPTAKTSVWWDIENCKVPKGCEGYEISQNVRSVLREMNYAGSLTINGYGDINQIPSRVTLFHVPPVIGVKDESDKKIIVDMLFWALENPAPANVMLISGDGDFSYLLHNLGMKGYDILLARPENTTALSLIAAAKTVLFWRSIVPTGSGSDQKDCKICNLACSSSVQLKSHFTGKKHMNTPKLVASQSAQVKPKDLWCNICEVHYPTDGKVEHISGRKHKNKLQVQAGHSS